jgi:hypothetical protein
MKKDCDQSKLLDALLADETWDTCSGRLQHTAIAALRATKKSRVRRAVIIQTMAVLAVLSTIALVLSRPERGWPSRSSNEFARNTDKPFVGAGLPAPTPATAQMPSSATYITEDQMLAMFPEGSCVLAEIDGQRQLVVLDDTAIRHEMRQQKIQ